jgi:transcriptional regulator with XRE-family HTH domain
MTKFQVYRRTYRWIDKDPICDAINSIITAERLKDRQVHELAGVTTQTIANWRRGATKKPRNDTLTCVSGALGYVRHDRLNRDGSVVPDYEKVRSLDWREEMEKQAKWILKHGTAKQKAAAKKRRGRPNGKA